MDLLKQLFPVRPAVPPALWLASGGSLLCGLGIWWAQELWTAPAVARAWLWPLLMGLALVSLGLGVRLLWRLVRCCAGPAWLRLGLYFGMVGVSIGAVLAGLGGVVVLVYLLACGQ